MFDLTLRSTEEEFLGYLDYDNYVLSKYYVCLLFIIPK